LDPRHPRAAPWAFEWRAFGPARAGKNAAERGGGFRAEARGWKLALYLLLINLPFGIVTALVARVIIGERP